MHLRAPECILIQEIQLHGGCGSRDSCCASKEGISWLRFHLAMAELRSMENSLLAARRVLSSSLEKSRDLASELDKTGLRLEDINRRLPSLELEIATVGYKCSLLAMRGRVDRAVGPAAAVLKVFDAVHGLEGLLLSDAGSDLFHYILLVKKLEEALRLLTSNCGLVIQWLEDILQFLEDNKVDDCQYLLNVRKALRILGELQGAEQRSRVHGGSLFVAFDKLETEFRHLLLDNSFPVAFSSIFDAEKACSHALPLPLPVVQKLQAIIDRMSASNRIENCISIYVEIRSSNARTSLQALDLDYLDRSLSEFESVQSIEDCINRWGNHMEFAVKHVFEAEYRFCGNVFQKLGPDAWMSCFAKIAVQSGMPGFIKFGRTVTKGKKDAIKLLKLLDIFAVLNKLRLHFNRLFGGKACIEIQTQTRDLIKKVVNGACEIFWELSVQVELQRQSIPPSDGSVPRLVCFVTDYCNELLEDSHKAILTQVLEIHHSWNHEKLEDEHVSKQVHSVVSAIELNLETWAKTYEDTALSYFFMMNNHRYLSENLKGTKVGEVMGESWLRAHQQATEYYLALYLRSSWGKLPAHLSGEGLVLLPGGRAGGRDLVKKRLKAFNQAFDDNYRKQSTWIVLDKSLRGKTCQLVVQMIIPAYTTFIQNYYLPLVERGGTSPTKHVQHSAESLDNMLSSLFQPKPAKFGGTKCTDVMGKIKSALATPAAA